MVRNIRALSTLSVMLLRCNNITQSVASAYIKLYLYSALEISDEYLDYFSNLINSLGPVTLNQDRNNAYFINCSQVRSLKNMILKMVSKYTKLNVQPVPSSSMLHYHLEGRLTYPK
jgi:hypothetical protein